MTPNNSSCNEALIPWFCAYRNPHSRNAFPTESARFLRSDREDEVKEVKSMSGIVVKVGFLSAPVRIGRWMVPFPAWTVTKAGSGEEGRRAEGAIVGCDFGIEAFGRLESDV